MTTPSTLSQQLSDFRAGFMQRVAPERVAMMKTATADLRATGIEQRALQAGDRAPHDLVLSDALGRAVTLASSCALERAAHDQR